MSSDRRTFTLNDSDAVLRQVLLELDDLRLSRVESRNFELIRDEPRAWSDAHGTLPPRAA